MEEFQKLLLQYLDIVFDSLGDSNAQVVNQAVKMLSIYKTIEFDKNYAIDIEECYDKFYNETVFLQTICNF